MVEFHAVPACGGFHFLYYVGALRQIKGMLIFVLSNADNHDLRRATLADTRLLGIIILVYNFHS